MRYSDEQTSLKVGELSYRLVMTATYCRETKTDGLGFSLS